MVGVPEVEWNFEQEPEQYVYLKKTEITQPLIAELISCKQKAFIAKSGKGYYAFSLIVRLDDYTEKEISPIFRTEMKWKKVKPKHVIINVEKDGEYLKWNISPTE